MAIKKTIQDFIMFQELQTLKEEIAANRKMGKSTIDMERRFERLSKGVKAAKLTRASKVKLVI